MAEGGSEPHHHIIRRAGPAINKHLNLADEALISRLISRGCISEKDREKYTAGKTKRVKAGFIARFQVQPYELFLAFVECLREDSKYSELVTILDKTLAEYGSPTTVSGSHETGTLTTVSGSHETGTPTTISGSHETGTPTTVSGSHETGTLTTVSGSHDTGTPTTVSGSHETGTLTTVSGSHDTGTPITISGLHETGTSTTVSRSHETGTPTTVSRSLDTGTKFEEALFTTTQILLPTKTG